MKTIEVILSMPIIASFAAGVNIVAGNKAATTLSEPGISSIASTAPAIALGAIVLLISSAVYFLAREIRQEATDERGRRRL